MKKSRVKMFSGVKAESLEEEINSFYKSWEDNNNTQIIVTDIKQSFNEHDCIVISIFYNWIERDRY